MPMSNCGYFWTGFEREKDSEGWTGIRTEMTGLVRIIDIQVVRCMWGDLWVISEMIMMGCSLPLVRVLLKWMVI